MKTILADIKKVYADVKMFFIHLSHFSSKRASFLAGFLGFFAVCFYFDTETRILVKEMHNGFFDVMFFIFHWYGKSYVPLLTIIILYTLGLVFTKPKLRTIGIQVWESYIVSGIVVTIIKSIFSRWRPYTEHGFCSFQWFTLGPNDHLSLPSGDVTIAFAYSVVIAGASKNRWWKFIWYLFAVLSSFGRIYHDQHWLSDVFAAAVIAISISQYFVHAQSTWEQQNG